MPSYTNATDSIRYSVEPLIEFPADSVKETLIYAKGLPTGVTLTDHEPTASPWVLLANITSVPANAVSVAAYDNIVVFNASDASISLSANEDDDNAIFIAVGAKEVYSNTSRLIGSLDVLTMGSGNVYIHGVK